MEPLDEESEGTDDSAGSKPRRGTAILVALAIVALVAMLIALHIAGGAPTHRR